MLSVQNEQLVHSVGYLSVPGHFTFWTECHSEEVLSIAKVLALLNKRLALVDSETCGCNSWHLTNHAMNMHVSVFLGLVAGLAL